MEKLLQQFVAAIAQPVHIRREDVEFTALPPGWEATNVNDLRTAPERVGTHVTLLGLDSFNSYVNRFKNGHSTIFITPDLTKLSGSMTLAKAFLEYHEAGGGTAPTRPVFLTHVASLTARPSLVYSKLLELDGKLMDQTAFAQALEDIARYSSSHAAADLLEVARTINLTSKGAFKNYEDDFSGSTEFRFDLQVSANAGTQERRLVVPSTIEFRCPLIDGLSETTVQTKFQYRIPSGPDGRVQLGIKVNDRAYLEEQAILEAASSIAESTGLHVLVGELSCSEQELPFF